MTGTSWLSVQNDLDRCGYIIGHPICIAFYHVALNSGSDANCMYSDIVGAFDVDCLVANQIRAGKIDLVILHRFYNHSRSRLTTLRMLFRSIRAVVSGFDQTISKLPQYFRFNRAILIESEESAPDPALICDEDYFESSRFQTLQ